ncbi:hypothetical protein L6386_03650 [bacterium]|nr:hypothetical protein [bacterium]
MRYIFGPVPSRRLGISLGVDLVPFKTCTFNCVYCQLGRTTNQTIKRKEYIKAQDILKELHQFLSHYQITRSPDHPIPRYPDTPITLPSPAQESRPSIQRLVK